MFDVFGLSCGIMFFVLFMRLIFDVTRQLRKQSKAPTVPAMAIVDQDGSLIPVGPGFSAFRSTKGEPRHIASMN